MELVPLQNPLPENPDQSASIEPVHTDGELSASYLVGAACAAEEATTTSAPASRLTHAIMDLTRIVRLRWIGVG
ncbi:hypothetical protein GCM10027436_78650 [Actinophytocola sediminis]